MEWQYLVKHAEHSEPALPSWGIVTRSQPEGICEIAQRAIDVYLLSKQPNGEVRGIGWWQSANGYTAMALCDIWSASTNNYDTLAKALRDCERRHSNFINEFNDDTLWWGLCCLHAYTIGGDIWFLERAKHIWTYVANNAVVQKGQAKFLDLDMEGACFWTSKPGEEQINSITTGLFAELSVRLALLEQESTSGVLYGRLPYSRALNASRSYAETARCSLGWILRCRYRVEEAVVLDNILLKKQEARDWTFTYTTGVAIGVCALLYEAIRDDEYMTLACHMAHMAMCRPSWVETDGVLTERNAYGRGNHEPWQNSDAVGFKAVLMRHLATLHDVIARTECTELRTLETAALIRNFVNINFHSQQACNTNGKNQYGPWWDGPFEMSTSHSQMAVLDVMAAAVLVNRRPKQRQGP